MEDEKFLEQQVEALQWGIDSNAKSLQELENNLNELSDMLLHWVLKQKNISNRYDIMEKLVRLKVRRQKPVVIEDQTVWEEEESAMTTESCLVWEDQVVEEGEEKADTTSIEYSKKLIVQNKNGTTDVELKEGKKGATKSGGKEESVVTKESLIFNGEISETSVETGGLFMVSKGVDSHHSGEITPSILTNPNPKFTRIHHPKKLQTQTSSPSKNLFGDAFPKSETWAKLTAYLQLAKNLMGGKPTFGMDGNTRWEIDPGGIYFRCLCFLFPQPIFGPMREAQSHLHAYRVTDVGFWIGSSREGNSSAVVQQYMEEQLVAAIDLFNRIIVKGHYTERTATLICSAIVHVVHICHVTGVMHRDLKPDLNGGPFSALMRNFVAATKWVIHSECEGEKGGSLNRMILQRETAIEEMVGMKALGSDKIGLFFMQGWCTTMEVAHTVEPKPGPMLNGFYKPHLPSKFYPLFTVAVKSQHISIKFQIPPACEILQMSANLCTKVGLLVESAENGKGEAFHDEFGSPYYVAFEILKKAL